MLKPNINHLMTFYQKYKTRKRNIELNKNILISPCDANLSVYRINKDNKFYIKGSSYSINELLKDNISKDYLNGYICIFRLCVDNYHHYCYIDNGYKSQIIIFKEYFIP